MDAGMNALVTICIVGVDDPAATAATAASATALGVPVLVGRVAAGEGGAPGAAVVELGDAPSWPAALARLVGACATPWALVVHSGELVHVDLERLAAECGLGATAWAVEHAVGLVPGCPLLPAERLVRVRGLAVEGTVAPRWATDAVATSTAVRLTGAPAPVRADAPTGRWLLRRAAAAERAEPTATVRAEVGVLLAATGHHDAALVRLVTLPDDLDPAAQRRYGRAALAATLAGGRPREARFAVLRWHRGCRRTGPAHAWLGQVELAAGRPGSAVRLYKDLAGVALVDDDGYALDPALVAAWRGVAEHQVDQLDARLAVGLDAMDDTPDERLPVLVAEIAALWTATRRPTAKLVTRLGDRGRAALVRVLTVGPVVEPADWLEVFTAVVDAAGLTARLAARLAEVAPMLSETEALEWAARLRADGHGGSCPLVARARHAGLDPLVRVRAAAMAIEVFGADETSSEALATAAAAVDVDELEAMLLLVDELSPDALGTAVLGAATTPARMLALADLLQRFGAEEQAEVLRAAAGEALQAGAGAR